MSTRGGPKSFGEDTGSSAPAPRRRGPQRDRSADMVSTEGTQISLRGRAWQVD